MKRILIDHMYDVEDLVLLEVVRHQLVRDYWCIRCNNFQTTASNRLTLFRVKFVNRQKCEYSFSVGDC